MDSGTSVGLNYSLIYLFLFFAPGFIGAGIFRLLAEIKPMKQFDFTIFALTLTVAANFASYFIFKVSMVPDIKVGQDRLILLSYDHLNLTNMQLVTLCSVVISVILSLCYISGILFRLLRRIGVTRKTGRASVFHDVFSFKDMITGKNNAQLSTSKWIQVHFKDGSRLTGWSALYDFSEERFELYLREVVVDPSKPSDDAESQQAAKYAVDGPGVYLNNFDEIKFIALLDGTLPKENS